MTAPEYEAKCKALFEKAKQRGVVLQFNQEDFDGDHLNCLWHGGWFAEVKLDDHLSIYVAIYGDVRATLFDGLDNEIAYVKDEQNAGLFKKEMENYIKNDIDLQAFLDNGSLVLSNNNWIEYGGVYYKDKNDHTGITIDVGIYEDNILDDDILEAIGQVLDDLDEIKEQIKKYSKY